jgi:glutamate racemase
MRAISAKPIGIFDSGVGGLTVARSIRKELPNEDIIYFGDTARVPYGNKSRETIIRFSKEIMEFMMSRKVKMVVVACNTASSFSLANLQRSYPIPVVGVIKPGVKEARRLSRNGKVGVIGTKSTISSRAYEKELARSAGRSYSLYARSCPLFVPLVENKLVRDQVTYRVAEKYLKPLRGKKIDTLILGCTHYPILKTVIGKVMKGVMLVDSSLAVAKEVRRILQRDGLLSGHVKKRGKMTCFVSDDPGSFRDFSGIFLKEKTRVKKAVL